MTRLRKACPPKESFATNGDCHSLNNPIHRLRLLAQFPRRFKRASHRIHDVLLWPVISWPLGLLRICCRPTCRAKQVFGKVARPIYQRQTVSRSPLTTSISSALASRAVAPVSAPGNFCREHLFLIRLTPTDGGKPTQASARSPLDPAKMAGLLCG